MHLRVTSPASSKKMICILKDMVFLLNYLTDTLERAQEAATRNVTQEKLFLEILQNLQEKTCARASFLIRLQPKTCNFIRPATVLKKKLWCSCFPVNIAKFLRTLFLQNTPGRKFLEFQLFSVLLWRLL